MEREVVERLATDRAGGELSDDGVKLLEWYLEEHPEAKDWAGEMEEMYAICAKTVGGYRWNDAQMTTASKDSRFGGNDRWSMKDRVLQIGRWVAVIILALAAGIIWGRWSVEAPMVESGKALVFNEGNNEPQIVKNEEEYESSGDRPGGFWETKIVATLDPKPQLERTPVDREGDFWSGVRNSMRKEKQNE